MAELPLHPGETIREFVKSRINPKIRFQRQLADHAGITQREADRG